MLARLPETGPTELIFLLFRGVVSNANGMAPVVSRVASSRELGDAADLSGAARGG